MDEQNAYRAVPIRSDRSATNPLVWFCVGYYLLAILWGVHSALAGDRSAGDLVFRIALGFFLAMWAVADARRRQRPIPRSQQQWFLLLAGIVVPGYVIVTRGWRGILWVAVYTVSWFAITTLAMHVTGWIYFGSAWWEALSPS